MSPVMRERLFDPQHVFDHPFTAWATIVVTAFLVLFPIGLRAWLMAGRVPRDTYDRLMRRWLAWLWITAAIAAAIILGRAGIMLAVAVFSLLCYNEYARTTGIFREKSVTAVVVLGILVVTFAVFDHYDRLFFASSSLTVALIAVSTIPTDRPDGYIQRVALGVLGFILFGFSLGYLGMFANHALYRPVIILIILGVVLTDMLSFAAGRLFRGPDLLPRTSPGRTLSGVLGALALATPAVALVGHFVFQGTNMDGPLRLLFLGFLISTLSQLGEFTLDSIKRDVGVQSVGSVLPGYGGLLDRFDSLVLVPPAVFHFLSVVLGPLGGDQAERIISGGW